MKCIRCGRDCKYRERSGRQCPHCAGKFGFEPREKDPLTDSAFQRCIEAVSAGGKLRWGVEHLYYEVCRRKRTKARAIIGVAAAATIGGVLSTIFAFQL